LNPEVYLASLSSVAAMSFL